MSFCVMPKWSIARNRVMSRICFPVTFRNLKFKHGLYSSFLGCLVYIFLGSSKDVPIGPTAMSGLLVFQAAQGNWQKAVLLTFLTGLIEIGMGFLQLGFLLDFVSGPVSAGFTVQ
uniref:SLC26A/SulP transporter domain-containing protein n=1 Tax=Megaselia scalaris TaxID=36166 RepID=T1GUR9_MEGSC